MLEIYSSDITEETRKELVGFIQWYNRFVGHEPLIVGGWAAWAYHGGIGSKDIDIVFPGQRGMQATLFEYFRHNGYRHRKTDLFDYEFYKMRKTSQGREVEVLIDAVSMDRRVQVTGTQIMLPWGLAEKFKRKYAFGNSADAYIITPELLVVYKIGALIGRSNQLGAATELQRTYYESKLWKDAQDVYGILENCRMDVPALSCILRESRLDTKSYVEDALDIINRYLEGHQRAKMNATWNETMRAAKQHGGKTARHKRAKSR